MQEQYQTDFRAWIARLKELFGGELPTEWPHSLVILPYWQQQYTPEEFYEVWRITKAEPPPPSPA